MNARNIIAAVTAGLLCSTASVVLADGQKSFNRIASFSVVANLPEGSAADTETAPEIITATEDGMTLIYSDSPLGGIGFVDIKDAANPKAGGFMSLDGEPTSVAVAGGKVLAGVNTSESFTAPSGKLAVIDIASQKVEATCDLGGQPDSVAVSPDKSIVAIAIENERDEDLNDGEIPQLPAGNITIFKLKDGVADCDSKIVTELTGIADIAPTDPEPEFVDINEANEIVVTIQENNHLAIINGTDGKLLGHFSAGSVDLVGVDVDEERALTFDSEQKGRLREPDAAKWLDNDRFVIANEGDYNGGSRGFTIFNKNGEELFESGLQFEYEVAMAGHYPEKRSGNKGVEPEGVEVGKFGNETYMFIAAERGSVWGVYKDTGGAPEYMGLIPSGIGPEGAVAIPSRGLLATANEKDLIEDGGVRAHVMLYELQDGAATYPQIKSVMKDGKPIGWGALSGLVADKEQAGKLYAVNDSFYRSQPSIFVIDATKKPAIIEDVIRVTRDGMPAQKLDMEGITIGPDGNFWIASEGRTDRLTPHAIYMVSPEGKIKKEIAFPSELLAVEKRFGSEGITFVGEGDDAALWIAIQREWKDDEKGIVKLVSYNLKSEEWGYVNYKLEPKGKGWVGLSEITAHGEYVYIIERDNQIGANAALKKLFKVKIADLKPAKLGEKAPIVAKEEVRDFIPDLKAVNGYVVDKIEGFAIDTAGNGFAVTDNDGVDDSSGETYFFPAGTYENKAL